MRSKLLGLSVQNQFSFVCYKDGSLKDYTPGKQGDRHGPGLMAHPFTLLKQIGLSFASQIRLHQNMHITEKEHLNMNAFFVTMNELFDLFHALIFDPQLPLEFCWFI